MRTAAIVPSWTTAVQAAPGSSQPQKAGTMRRWAVLEIGRNSVSPCVIPRTISSNKRHGGGTLAHLSYSSSRSASFPCRSREASISSTASSREYQPSTVTFFRSRSL